MMCFFKSSPEDTFSLLLETEKGRERNIDVREKHRLVASHLLPDWGWTLQPRHVSDWELNPQPFSYGMMFQSAEPHQPFTFTFYYIFSFLCFLIFLSIFTGFFSPRKQKWYTELHCFNEKIYIALLYMP